MHRHAVAIAVCATAVLALCGCDILGLIVLREAAEEIEDTVAEALPEPEPQKPKLKKRFPGRYPAWRYSYSEADQAYFDRVIDTLEARDIDAVEALLEETRGQQVGNDGSKKDFFYLLASTYADDLSPEELDAYEAFVAEWSERKPESAVPLILLAHIHITRAWNARGSGYAHTVTAEGWRAFHKQLGLARRYLDRVFAIDFDTARPYELAIIVAIGQGAPHSEAYEYFEEGLKRFPEKPSISGRMANFLLPKWHGSAFDLRTAADRAVEWTRDKAGEKHYFEFARSVGYSEGFREVIAGFGFSYGRIKQGYHDTVGEGPPHRDHQIEMAAFACYAGDKKTAKQLFEEAGDFRCWYDWHQNERHLWQLWALEDGPAPDELPEPLSFLRLRPDAFKESVTGLIEDREFKELDQLADFARQTETHMHRGTYGLRRIYELILDYGKEQLDEEEFAALLDDWEGQYPESPTVHVLRSEVLFNQAWATAHWREKPPEKLELLAQADARAAKALELAPKDAQAYVCLFKTRLYQAEHIADEFPLMEEAWATVPLHRQLYWYPVFFCQRSETRTDDLPLKIAERCAEVTRERLGDAAYFAVAGNLGWWSHYDTVCTRYGFDYERIKRGYDDYLVHIAAHDGADDKMCCLACAVGDRDRAARFFDSFEYKYDELIWEDEPFWEWRAWAVEDGPNPDEVAKAAEEAAAQEAGEEAPEEEPAG